MCLSVLIPSDKTGTLNSRCLSMCAKEYSCLALQDRNHFLEEEESDLCNQIFSTVVVYVLELVHGLVHAQEILFSHNTRPTTIGCIHMDAETAPDLNDP